MAPSTSPSHALGRWGERVAARALEADGWRILARNYRAGHGEVDLVARRGDILAFVEVKTRAVEACGGPLEAITHRKRREVERVARHFLSEHAPGVGSVRFDAVAVHARPDGVPPRIEHVEDAWRPGGP